MLYIGFSIQPVRLSLNAHLSAPTVKADSNLILVWNANLSYYHHFEMRCIKECISFLSLANKYAATTIKLLLNNNCAVNQLEVGKFKISWIYVVCWKQQHQYWSDLLRYTMLILVAITIIQYEWFYYNSFSLGFIGFISLE